MRTIYEAEDGKQYESEDEAREADKQYLATQKKEELEKTERKEAAVKVTDAFKAAAKAKREANEEMQKFLDKYGSFHETFREDEAKDFFEDPIDVFFNHFFF